MLHVVVRKRISSRKAQAPHQKKFRGYTPRLAEPVLIPVNNLHWPIHVAGAVIHKRDLLLDGLNVTQNEGLGSTRAGAHPIDRAASRFHPDHIVAEIAD